MAEKKLVVPTDLAYYVREGRCVLFAGAGLSASAGLPTWPTLLERMIAATGERLGKSSAAAAELRGLLDSQRYLEIADYCRDVLGEERYRTEMSAYLTIPKLCVPQPHRLIADMPFAAIVTTNFDPLLEAAFAHAGHGWPKTLTHKDLHTLALLLFSGTFFILKAHGDLDQPETIALTSRDYATLIHASPEFNTLLSTLLLTKAVLFIGYSLKDLDFRLLFEGQLSMFRGNVPVRYALMDDMTTVEADTLFKTSGVKALRYDSAHGHGAVLDFLRELHETVTARRVRGSSEEIPLPNVLETADFARPSTLLPSSRVLFIGGSGRAVDAVLTMGDGQVIQRGVRKFVDPLSVNRRLEEFQLITSMDVAKRLGRLLARCLPSEVLSALRLMTGKEVLTLQISRALEHLPWELVWIDDRPLFLRQPLVRVPTWISDQARGYPRVHTSIRTLLVGNAGGDLRGSAIEIKAISKMYRQEGFERCDVLAGEAATFDAVVGSLMRGEYDIVHFSGHAGWDGRDSGIALSKNARLFASDLQSVLNRYPPAILVINAPWSAFGLQGVGPQVEEGPETRLGGDELSRGVIGRTRGFAEVVLTAGVGAFVGSFSRPIDNPVFAVTFHKELLAGKTAVKAMHRALRQAAAKSSTLVETLAYTLVGYPELSLRGPRKYDARRSPPSRKR